MEEEGEKFLTHREMTDPEDPLIGCRRSRRDDRVKSGVKGSLTSHSLSCEESFVPATLGDQ